MDCSKISQGLQAAKCNVPPVPGTAPKVWLYNWSDVRVAAAKTEASGGPLVREGGIIISDDMANDFGKIGFTFESLDNSTEGNVTYNKGAYFGNWQHDLILRIFTKSQKSKQFVEGLNGARVVAVVENKDQAGNCVFEMYGFYSGLELNEATGTTTMADLVVYQLTLGSGENSKESTLPLTIDSGSGGYNEILADLKATLVAAP